MAVKQLKQKYAEVFGEEGREDLLKMLINAEALAQTPAFRAAVWAAIWQLGDRQFAGREKDALGRSLGAGGHVFVPSASGAIGPRDSTRGEGV
jgi:hypothetical protein